MRLSDTEDTVVLLPVIYRLPVSGRPEWSAGQIVGWLLWLDGQAGSLSASSNFEAARRFSTGMSKAVRQEACTRTPLNLAPTAGLSPESWRRPLGASRPADGCSPVAAVPDFVLIEPLVLRTNYWLRRPKR